jgi:pimeloyl-ACP methyl ester carboxylesterase
MLSGHLVQTADLRMHCLQRGTGDPVVLIHGFPETSYSWRHQLAALSEHYAVFAPDTRGFGQRDKPGTRVTRQILAQDVINFMDALGIERAAIVGHDWGGIIAFKLAIDWPHRVTRLALLDTLCTVWPRLAQHGYWFKAEPYPEEFFAKYHRGFIETVITGKSSMTMPGRPESPWNYIPAPIRSWASADDLEHYARAFADPASHAHAISYYRDALPFHIVHEDPAAAHGERFEYLSPRKIAEMWLHPDGYAKHPLFAYYMDYGPEDRHKRFTAPALWLYARAASGAAGAASTVETVPSGNPFLDQFSRYFPDLHARPINAGHFFIEEAPETTNRFLLDFLKGRI